MRRFWLFQTRLGGGKELKFLTVFGLIFCNRSRALYYLAVITIYEFFLGEFKMLYHDPRPYMVETSIKPVYCSREFGNPSGHSLAAALFSIVVFLDLYHASPIRSDLQGKPRTLFANWFVYFVSGLLLLYWAASIPYTRYVMGLHSADQLVYGSTLGVWSGFFMHFYFRDNFIYYVEKVFLSQETEFTKKDGRWNIKNNQPSEVISEDANGKDRKLSDTQIKELGTLS